MTTNERPGDEHQALFEPDTLLPSQHADRTGRRRFSEGEHRLMVAILEDAIDVYRKQAAARDTRKRHMFEDAEAWIEDRDSSWIFSFENICTVLDLEPDYIRRGLREWKRRARAAAAAGTGNVVRLERGSERPMKAASGSRR
ncbi:MAG TPA: hypothetical protein VNO26_15070 [Candidatus Limnocylindria bacterium]|nr:hypothetical protein [Candidatus Limnocylindria bacterium]